MLGAKRIAIDFGTANSVVFVEGRGVVLQEPTVVALSPKERKVLAVGAEAKEMLGKTPENVLALRPLKNGSIAHYRAAEALLKRFLDKSIGSVRLSRPEVIISVPAGITSVEERAVVQALNAAGAGKIYMLPEPIAAAIGAELPLHTSAGNIIVNMGGGTAEIAVISLNGIVAFDSLRGAGDEINDAIADYLKKQRGLLIGEQMAEKVKMKIASAIELPLPLEMEVKGSNAKSGMPDSMSINSNELLPAVQTSLKGVVYSIKKVLGNTPPELSSDIIDRGVVLSGGTALLQNSDKFFTKAIGVPAHIVEDPLLCVTRGLSTALENIEQFKRSFK